MKTMKTLMTASALILTSNVAMAASVDYLQKHGYDKPSTLTEPMPSSSDTTVSLDTWNEGNPDHSSHARHDGMKSKSTRGFASSLDDANEGNPDHA